MSKRIGGDRRAAFLTLADAFFANLQRNDCEYGGWEIDPKRPFGNSDVEGDILEMLDEKPEGDDGDAACWSSSQREYAAKLYADLGDFLRDEWKARREGVER